MNNTERIVRVMVFYKINIFKEIIFRALHDLLPDYVLNITQVDSTEQALAAVADNNVDVFFTEFNYLLNHKEWSAGNDSNLMIVFYVQIMPDDLVMQLHRF